MIDQLSTSGTSTSQRSTERRSSHSFESEAVDAVAAAQTRASARTAPDAPLRDATDAEPCAASAEHDAIYALRLFVSGMTPRSMLAVGNVRAICEKFLPGRYELDVVDIYKSPQSAVVERILATPTLVKTRPLPPRRVVGDLSDRERVLFGLGLIEN